MIPIIVLNYNGIRFLKACIDSLLNQTYRDSEIIVVDNASNDGSVQFLKNKYPDIGIVGNEWNYGFASAYNRVIKRLDSKYVALLNNDVIVNEDWMKNLVDCIESDAKIFACGSRILLLDPAGRINHAGARVTILGGAWDEKFLEPDHLESKETYPTGCACGAAMMLNRQLFLELGGFDDDFFAYFEDADLSYRAWLSGYKVMHCPRSIAYHALSGSWGRRITQQRIFLAEKNRAQLALKNFEAETLTRFLPSLVTVNTAKTLAYLLGRGVDRPSTLIRGDFWSLSNLPGIWRKRRLVQLRRKVSDRELESRGVLAGLRETLAEAARLRLRRKELAIQKGHI